MSYVLIELGQWRQLCRWGHAMRLLLLLMRPFDCWHCHIVARAVADGIYFRAAASRFGACTKLASKGHSAACVWLQELQDRVWHSVFLRTAARLSLGSLAPLLALVGGHGDCRAESRAPGR